MATGLFASVIWDTQWTALASNVIHSVVLCFLGFTNGREPQTHTHTNAQACWGRPVHILWYMKHACQHADGAHPPGPQRLTPFARSCIHTLLLNRRSVGLLVVIQGTPWMVPTQS
jgi:hypothetical protein